MSALERLIMLAEFARQGKTVTADDLQVVIDEIDLWQDALIVGRENARTQLKMTLRKWSAFCGVSPTNMSKWTCGQQEREPDIICRGPIE